jgi:hypothetical protein
MSATVGTTAFSANNCFAYTGSGISGTVTIIEGTGGTQTAPTYPYLSIWLLNYNKTTGTFNFDSTLSTNYAEYLTSLTNYKLSSTGSVTLASVSPNIVGTFKFTATDGTVVSSGSFTAKSN